MSVHQIGKIANYVRYLQENPSELDILFRELLIGVTNFFRDADVWQILKDKIFPEMFNQLGNGHVLRAWVSACSTGEEAYSLAIVFKEALEEIKTYKNISLQIFATDIDKDAIEIARKGIFSENIFADVSQERINKYFVRTDEGIRINATIREMIVFAPHNVIKDPPFTKLNFLSCRNLLIYMEPELQKKMMALFHYSLNTDGIMMLGSAENDSSKNGIFTALDTKSKLYKRSIASITNELIDFPSSYSQKRLHIIESPKPTKIIDNIESITNELLIQNFTPPSVLINEQGDILYITGRIGKYLELAAGKANMNIYAMAREDLSSYLIRGIRKASINYEAVVFHNVRLRANGDTKYIDITIQRIEKPNVIKGAIMIVFTDVAKIINPVGTKIEKDNPNIPLQDLGFELKRVNDELQSAREEMQTSQEELKSSNEELQSSNEELQSTNEELTTSKEEMQSLNEELQTINAEMHNKITDFELANNDMKNLLNSTDIATLFLDKFLNIRRFTDQITKLIKLRPSDVGRPFTDMVSDLEYPEIEEHAKEVMRTLIFKETDISASNSRWFTVRIMPYRTFDDRIDGLVITFIDITIAKLSELKQSKAKEIIEISERMLCDSQALAHIGSYKINLNVEEFNINTWQGSPEIYKIFGIDKTYPHSFAGWLGFVHPDSKKELLAYYKQVISQRIRFDYEYKIIRINDGVERWVQGIGELEYDDKGEPIKINGSIQDITERKQLQQILIQTNKELLVENKEKKKLETELNKANALLKKHNIK